MFSFFNKFKDFFQKKPGELVLAGMILIGLALISFYFTLFLFSLSDIEEGVASVHLEIAQKTKSKIEGILDENVKALNDLAQILDVSKEKKIIIDRFLKERKAFTQIAVLDNQGWEILKSSRALVFAPEDLRDFFWSETFVTPMEGEIYLSRVYFSEKSEPLLTISLPIKSSPGQISGVLSAEFSLQEIWNTVAEIEVGASGQVYLVDAQGYLIAHPNIDLVLKKINLLKRRAVEEVIIGKKIVKGLGKEEEYFNEKGEKVYAVGLPFEETGWGVFIEEPIKDAWVTYRRIRNLGLISILATITLFLILFFNIRTLIKTSQGLKKSKVALEESKVTLEIKVEARTRELKELAEGLDEKVKEKTKELQERIGELEKFQKLTVGRELKMIVLKEEIKKLKKELEKSKGRPN